ncbi:hypothetical protein PRIPAC_93960, partial [Pristionchus pacificus]|uniref:Tyrosine-protein kinase n=1 Tax=Pristionchus pacificus TaxID=54126 RepID=A0A2A6BB21_PRIPA
YNYYETFCSGMLSIYKALVYWWHDIWNPINKTKVELIALRDFSPTLSGSSVLSIRKGDRFLLISDSDKQWWYVRHCVSRKRGFVAKTIVARVSDEPHLEWISIEASAEKAENILLDNRFGAGSFIIRPRTRENISEYLAISVKKLDQNAPIVAHYVVCRENGEFRIENGTIRFDSLRRLIEHYSCRQNTSKNLELSYCVKKSQAMTPWQFEMDVILKGRSLGKGNFGEVFHGTMFGSEIVALKSFKAGTTEPLIVQEAEIARHVNHENVIRTIGVCRNPLMIITEFMPNGSLHDYLRKKTSDGHDLNDAVKLSIAIKIARGMAFLGNKGIVHRDLAARNVLVGETHDIIKIADFGMARALLDKDYYISHADELPWKWTAPEALAREGKVFTSSDVWSYGVTVWEVYSGGEVPFKDITRFAHFKKMLESKELQLCRPVDCPVEAHKLMLRCCSYDRSERPTFEKICELLSAMQPRQITEELTEVPARSINPKAIRPIPRRKAHNRRRYRPRVPCRNRYVIRVARAPTRDFGMDIPAEPNFQVNIQGYQTVQYLRT